MARIKRFEYRLFNYIFSEEKNIFIPAEFSLENNTYTNVHERYGKGLTTVEFNDHKIYYGNNSTAIPEKSIMQLLMDEVLSPFYIF